MNLILIGYRGTGKTSVAKVLAKRLKMKVIHLDEEIVKKAKMPINEIVKKYGWKHFRKLETEVVKEISGVDDCIIDTGGGVILKKENINNLRKNSIIVLLTADVLTIIDRIKKSSDRPALTKKGFIDEVEEVLKERKHRYIKAADYEVDTTELSINEVADRIIEYLKFVKGIKKK